MSSLTSVAAGVSAEPIRSDRLARLAGLLYLSTLPTGGLGVFGARSLLENNVSAAVTQIEATRSFLEAGILAGAAAAITWLPLAVLFYGLLRSASARRQ